MGRLLVTCLILCAAPFVAAAQNEAFRYYAIGASFLNDHHPHNASYFSPWFGRDIEAGFHVRGGSTTTDIINNPTDASTADPYGYYEDALPNYDWDALVVQVFAGVSGSVEADVANLQYFVSLMDSPETPVYIYETWPWFNDTDEWELPLSEQANERRREYFHRVADELAPTIENPVYLIPTGEVIVSLAKAVDNDAFQAIDRLIPDVFRDAQHASEISGALLSAVTVGTITGVNPMGTPPPPAYFEGRFKEDPNQWDTLLAAAWQAAAMEPRSPIEPLETGDYNGDGLVGVGDFLTFQTQYGQNQVPGLNADGNADGVTDAVDYLLWRESAVDSEDLLAPPLSGDFNQNDTIDDDDIALFDNLHGAIGQPADLNSDGVVDAVDYVAWRESTAASAESQGSESSDGNAQGLLDVLDQALLSSQYGAIGQPADGNGDGVVNAVDYILWRESRRLLESTAIGDYNGDGFVTASDRRNVFELYGMEVPAGHHADGNGDGVINSLDYLHWRENIGASSSAVAAIPEPTGAASLLSCISVWIAYLRGRNACDSSR